MWRINQSIFDENKLWIGTADGVCYYNIKTGKISRFNVSPQFPLQFNKSFATLIEQNYQMKIFYGLQHMADFIK